MLVDADPGDLPGPLVAASALAAAEAVERLVDARVAIKWPNDLWIAGRKLGGLLLESAGDGRVAVGLGLNVARVPATLAPTVAAATTSIADATGVALGLAPLLTALLRAMDRRLADLPRASSRAGLIEAWGARQALLGSEVSWREGGAERRGRLLAASLEGLDVEEPAAGRRRLRAEHVQDLRAAAPEA
jgi:BirA family biotin operon repressor/biotin-[acetyl-CoA-carboxylase] ligase